MYHQHHTVGEYVVPTDLPRAFICRVVVTHPVGATDRQVLELVPLHGPWPPGTRLIRGSTSVRSAIASELWSTNVPERPRPKAVRAEGGAQRRHVARAAGSRRRRLSVVPVPAPWGTA